MATTLQQLGNGVETVCLPDGSWLIQAEDAVGGGTPTVWEWDDEYEAAAAGNPWYYYSQQRSAE